MNNGILEDLWKVVRSIPKGKVMSYGEVGARLKNSMSGRMVGRWMAQAPDGVPWWRVVAKDGHLPIAKRGPRYASEQETRLKKERVPFLHPGRIDMENAAWFD